MIFSKRPRRAGKEEEEIFYSHIMATAVLYYFIPRRAHKHNPGVPAARRRESSLMLLDSGMGSP
jgi:hypothetical protein